eukprot:scaffold201592_cov69-Attheya_sp.AAC.1
MEGRTTRIANVKVSPLPIGVGYCNGVEECVTVYYGVVVDRRAQPSLVYSSPTFCVTDPTFCVTKLKIRPLKKCGRSHYMKKSAPREARVYDPGSLGVIAGARLLA